MNINYAASLLTSCLHLCWATLCSTVTGKINSDTSVFNSGSCDKEDLKVSEVITVTVSGRVFPY